MRAMLAAGGRMGELVGACDWGASPLGPAGDWPQSLRSSLSICLSSRFPAFVFWGPDLVQLYNDSFVPVLGAKHPAALGRAARDTWAETWDVVGPMLERVLAGGEAAYFEDMLVTLERSGFTEECYFTFCYSPVLDESGGIGGVFGTVSETTAQVVEERRLAILAELNQETRTLGSAAAVCQAAVEVFSRHPVDVPFALIYVLDSGGGEATLAASSGLPPDSALSPAAVTLTGTRQQGAFSWPLAEARAGAVEASCPADAQLTAMAREGFSPPSAAMVLPVAAAGAEHPAGLLVLGLNSGRPLDESYRRFARLAAGHVSSAIADATALESARQRAEQLAALDRAKTMFFSNVSHELRTPLTLMLGPLEDILGNPGGPGPGDRGLVEMAHRNAVRLLRQVNTLLDFSSARDADSGLRPEPADLAALTAELADLFQVAVERGGLRLVLDCPPLPGPVWLDRDMWEKVILNLLSNAFKFTLHGEIKVTVDAFGGQARVRVSDTGAGIPEAELPYLFDRFHRVATAAARSDEGSGIGLSLVRDLVRRHDGTVTVTSAVGTGSTFTVLLPFGGPSPADAPAAAPPTRAEPAAYVQEALSWVPTADGPGSAGPPEVLIVDDNADMRARLARTLAPHWRVRVVHDGQAALEAIRCQPPELVLTDVMMPRLDGPGLLSQLRSAEATRDIPVIMVSARAGAEAVADGLDAGADDYLIKPFTTAELIARVRTQLRAARQRRQAATRIQALSDITGELNASLDPRQISQTLARHLVPAYAADCTIRLHDDTLPAADGPGTPGGLRAGSREPAEAAAPGADSPLALPLTSHGRPVGTVTLAGLTPAALHPAERPFLNELAGRAAVALDNAARFQREHGIASYLQAAMLSDVPATPGLDSAALYRPADREDLVGGDWYDCFHIPPRPGCEAGTSLAVAIGDITGHDMHAATIMSQVRSMLRQAVLDHPALGPQAAVTALDRAIQALPIDATGTLVLGHLDRQDTSWTFTWTNAGHPPPMLCHPDGRAEDLRHHDPMLDPAFADTPRTQHRRHLAPGTTILLYTDGLTDRPGSDVKHDLQRIAALLAAHRDQPLDNLLNAVVQIAGPRPADDIALLAIRTR
jgi:signal transduction histidine kinase/CheY-like chemotaxis protein/serine phosphatase RsbU (regulator of sigma subunit)